MLSLTCLVDIQGEAARRQWMLRVTGHSLVHSLIHLCIHSLSLHLLSTSFVSGAVSGSAILQWTELSPSFHEVLSLAEERQ